MAKCVSITSKIPKFIRVLAGFALIFGSVEPALAELRDEGQNLYASTKLWSPFQTGINGTIGWIDPYSVYKVNENDWDVNITFTNNQNQYLPEDTATYRIDCKNLNYQFQGWRINGVLKEWTGPLGFWLTNPSKKKLSPDQMIWTVKEYVCGIGYSGSTYYWGVSWFQDDQIRQELWIRDNEVTISQDDRDLRKVNVMYKTPGREPSFLDFFAKCDQNEGLEARNGETLYDWTPVGNVYIRALLEKMCSNRYDHITYQTDSLAMPVRKPSPDPAGSSAGPAGSAEQKCIELGFTQGTDDFNQCVIMVSE